MKLKHFFLFIILSLVLSLSGISCSGSANPGNSSQTPSTSTTPGKTTETPETTKTPETTETTEPADPVDLDNTLTAMKLAQAMECGWNLGNTLDARDGGSDASKVYPFNQGKSSETYWGEVETTKAIIETGIKNGYKTIRIPVTWCNHLTDTNYTIDSEWMARVKQIVDWAYDAGYYVILNEHHSVHDKMSTPLKKCEGYIVRPEDEAESKAFLKAIWKQISQTFNNSYDEHLIFETMNEPRDTAHNHCWNTQPDTCDICKAEVTLVNEYNQLILDTIRSSGGNNANRFVMVPAMGTGINEALKDGFKLPEDSAKDRLIVTGHMYPLDSGGTGHGSHHFESSTQNEITYNTRSLYSKFVSKGIPVVIGECGAARKASEYNDELQKSVYISDYIVTFEDRLNCFSFFAEQAGKYTMPFINWDCGGEDGMATVDRKNCKMFETEDSKKYVETIINAWKKGNENAGSPTVIEPEEISLDDIVVWDAEISSFDKTSGLLTLGEKNTGANNWFGEKDISAFKTVEISYKNGTANIEFYLAYTDDTNSDRVSFSSGSGTKSLQLDTTKKLKAIFFQAKEASVSITLEKIILKP